MRTSSLINAPLLVAGIVSASPLSQPASLFDRGEPPKSKMTIKVSDNRINWGNVSPEKVMNSVRERCKESTCPSDGWDLETWYLNKPSATSKDKKFKITPLDTTLNNPENYDAIIDAMRKFMDEKEITKYEKQTAVRPDAPCRRDPGFKCKKDDDKVEVDNWQGPAAIEIIVSENNPSNNNVKDHLRLKFEIVDENQLPGLCSALAGMTARAAAAVNPWVGVAFSFGGLFCIGK